MSARAGEGGAMRRAATVSRATALAYSWRARLRPCWRDTGALGMGGAHCLSRAA